MSVKVKEKTTSRISKALTNISPPLPSIEDAKKK